MSRHDLPEVLGATVGMLAVLTPIVALSLGFASPFLYVLMLWSTCGCEVVP